MTLPHELASWHHPMTLGRGLIAGGHVARDKLVDLAFDRTALQHDAAIGPFDPAIAGLDLRLRQNDQTPLEPALRSQTLNSLARNFVKGLVDSDHQMRGRY